MSKLRYRFKVLEAFKLAQALGLQEPLLTR